MNANTQHTRDPWFKRHPKITLMGVALVAVIIILILGELIARILFPAWRPANAERVTFWRYDELLGWAHKPGQHGRFVHNDFTIEVRINSQGLRDAEYALERNEKKRMLVLGDSFAWGFGVQQHECFSEVMEAQYPDWEIINASVSGYGTDQQLLYLKERGVLFEPDVVLLLFHPNDFSNNLKSEEYRYFKPHFVVTDDQLLLQNVPVPKATFRQRLDRYFLEKTYLWKKIYQGSFIAYGRLKTLLRRKESDYTQGNDSVHEPAKHAVTRRLIESMNAFTKDMDARFVLVSTPMGEEERGVLEDVASELNLPYLRLDHAFLETGVRTVFPHDFHWNAAGHKFAANAIIQFLEREKIFE